MWKLYLTLVWHYGVNTDIDLSSHVSREGKKIAQGYPLTLLGSTGFGAVDK